jgi:hypothetical protein
MMDASAMPTLLICLLTRDCTVTRTAADVPAMMKISTEVACLPGSQSAYVHSSFHPTNCLGICFRFLNLLSTAVREKNTEE